MFESAYFSNNAPIIQGVVKPCPGWVVGYTAIIDKLTLQIPLPAVKAMVSEKYRRKKKESWLILSVAYLPQDNASISKIEALYNHLVFALKYEGVNLLVFSKLREKLSSEELLALVNTEPLGQYSRRIWFLIEWVSGTPIIGKSDINKKSYVPLVDTKLQFAVSGIKSPRHLVLNNLPGTNKFCALIRKTEKIEQHLSKSYVEENRKQLAGFKTRKP
jgi:hypothetical protein